MGLGKSQLRRTGADDSARKRAKGGEFGRSSCEEVSFVVGAMKKELLANSPQKSVSKLTEEPRADGREFGTKMG